LEHLSLPQGSGSQRRFLAIGFLDIDVGTAGVSMVMVEHAIDYAVVDTSGLEKRTGFGPGEGE
jgi:hypothetical protein